MLSSIAQLINQGTPLLHFSDQPGGSGNLTIFRKIEKHLVALHHRNAQLRKAILSGSEEGVKKRHAQFVKVFHSYVRLIVVDLHGSIEGLSIRKKCAEYEQIREETFAGYEKFLKLCNRSTDEMLKLGSDFTRELFKLELQLKKFEQLEQRHLYPILMEASVRNFKAHL